MRTPEKCRNKHNNNNPDNPLTSHRTDRGKNHRVIVKLAHHIGMDLLL